MKQTKRTIVIRHLQGSKANQLEEFNFDQLSELTLGRDTASLVRFDPDFDTTVSRRHARISWQSPEAFTIEDLGSTNGTLVNQEIITQPTTIHAGDSIQLGVHGPVLQFDLDPRPASHIASTRLVPAMAEKATELKVPLELEGIGNDAQRGIGKQTFERAIQQERKRSSRTILASLAGLLLILLAMGFSFRDRIFKERIVVNNNTREIVSEYFDASKIAANHMNKVVFIEFGYKLIHTQSGDDVYHRYMVQEDPKTKQKREVALYIEIGGTIEPFLGLKKDVETGQPIAVSGASGTGFVVDKNGFILTNRHVADSWNTSYSFPASAHNGLLLRVGQKGLEPAGTLQYPPMDWVPSESKFFGEKPISGKILEGQNTYMEVTFAKNDLRTPAKIVRVSNTHDVAMIKIDLPGELDYVELNEDEKTVSPGQRVLVMGYPGVSPDVVIGKASDDVFNRKNQIIKIPDPTVTDCSIGKIIRGQVDLQGANIMGYASTFGDVYQLTTSETGQGNSGGPVFDKDGKVIAIFSALQRDPTGTQVTFAIPIRYGSELMRTQRVIQ